MKIRIFPITVLNIILFASLLFAYNGGNGEEDMPTPSGGCSNGFGCHGSISPDVKLILTSEADDGNWNTPGESGTVVCTLNIDVANSDADIAGAMLLNASGANIKDDGWAITADPNSNPSPYNYNEQVCPSGDYVYTWSVNAPSAAGGYQVKTRMLFDDGGAVHDTSNILFFNFVIGVLENENLVDTNVPGLLTNYPNPFCTSTDIRYVISKNSKVVLAIYDVTGRGVRILVNTNQKAGYYTANWNGTDTSGKRVATGIYFYRLDVGKFTATRKLILLK